MKTPLTDNKHIYYYQINTTDDLSLIDQIDDLEGVAIYHILRTKFIHNKGKISQKEAYKNCNAFDEKTKQKVDYILKFFFNEDDVKKLVQKILKKSTTAKKSRLRRVTNVTTKVTTNDVSNEGTKEKDKDKDILHKVKYIGEAENFKNFLRLFEGKLYDQNLMRINGSEIDVYTAARKKFSDIELAEKYINHQNKYHDGSQTLFDFLMSGEIL